jgi:hypothetical protein
VKAVACLLFALAMPATAAPVSFARQIVPILVDQCLECHRAEKAKGSYRLDTVEQLLRPGDSGEPPLVAGKPEEGELMRLILSHDDDDRMPKKADPLPAAQIELLRAWIVEGAAFDVPDRRSPLAGLVERALREPAPERYPRPLPVTALALNGDGKVLVTGGYHEVLAWNPADGKLRARISDLPERILGLSFVAGGPLLAVAGGSPGRSGEVWLVDFAKPTERRRLASLRDCALCAVTTPDGKFLITGGADNRVRGFALPEGRPVWDVEAHADWVLALAISPDGQHVATASRDRTAKVLATASGSVEGTFTGHSVPVLSVAFGPDSRELISGGSDGELRRWELNGAAKKDGSLRPAGRSEALALGFLDAGTAVAATADGGLRRLDLKTRKVTGQVTAYGDRLTALLLRPHGAGVLVISASHDGEVRLTDGTGGEKRRFVASPGW